MAPISNLVLLVMNQVLTRLITFGLNLMTVRYVGAVAFGIANIHLYFFYTTILFVTREPFRRAILQSKQSPAASDHKSYATRVMQSMQTIQTGLALVASVVTTLLVYLYLMTPPDFVRDVDFNPITFSNLPQRAFSSFMSTLAHILKPSLTKSDLPMIDWYLVSVMMFLLSAFIELSAEHLYVHSQRLGLVSLRVASETTANIFKCIITAAAVLYFDNRAILSTGTSLFAFGMGQLAYSSGFALVLYGYFLKNTLASASSAASSISQAHEQPNSHPPTSIDQDTDGSDAGRLELAAVFPFFPSPRALSCLFSFDTELISWARAYFLQSVVKHVLTEGEKIILVWLSPFSSEESGAYALVTNLGGLFVRMIFQPIEENAHLVFTTGHRFLQGIVPSRYPSDDCDRYNLEKSRFFTTVASTTLLATSIGLFLATFGSSMAFSVIRILYGPYWSNSTNAPQVLAVYSLSLPVLAFNGVTEGFFFNTIPSPTAMTRANAITFAIGVIYTSSILLTLGLPTIAALLPCGVWLILCNLLAMSLRSFVSLNHMWNYFQYFPKQPEVSTAGRNQTAANPVEITCSPHDVSCPHTISPFPTIFSLFGTLSPHALVLSAMASCFLTSHVIVTFLLYNQEWITIVWHTFSRPPLSTSASLGDPTTVPLNVHFAAIACVLPLALTVLGTIYWFDWNAIRSRRAAA